MELNLSLRRCRCHACFVVPFQQSGIVPMLVLLGGRCWFFDKRVTLMEWHLVMTSSRRDGCIQLYIRDIDNSSSILTIRLLRFEVRLRWMWLKAQSSEYDSFISLNFIRWLYIFTNFILYLHISIVITHFIFLLLYIFIQTIAKSTLSRINVIC